MDGSSAVSWNQKPAPWPRGENAHSRKMGHGIKGKEERGKLWETQTCLLIHLKETLWRKTDV